MTRRFPDIRRPRGETGTSAAIGAGLGMLSGAMVLIIIGMALAVVFGAARPAHATWKPEYGQFPPSDS